MSLLNAFSLIRFHYRVGVLISQFQIDQMSAVVLFSVFVNCVILYHVKAVLSVLSISRLIAAEYSLKHVFHLHEYELILCHHACSLRLYESLLCFLIDSLLSILQSVQFLLVGNVLLCNFIILRLQAS